MRIEKHQSMVWSILAAMMVVCILGFLVWPLLPAHAGPPLPPRQPTPTQQPPPTQLPHPADGDDDDKLPPPPSASAVSGTVTRWGYRGEPKVAIELSGVGWRTEMTSDDNGFYSRGGLGIGIGLVNLRASPWCKPTTQDVAVRFDGYKAFEVNLVCYDGETPPVLPVTPVMSADRQQASPGEQVTYTVTVANSLSAPMTGVTLTALLPLEMEDIEASSGQGNTEVWDRLVTAEIGRLEPREKAQVTIVATVKKGTLIGTVLSSHASLLYTAGLTAQSLPVTVEVK